MKGGKDIQHEISNKTCEENSVLITHFVHALLIHNIHVSGDFVDVELFSFTKLISAGSYKGTQQDSRDTVTHTDGNKHLNIQNYN
jgi:hypothetical protein